MKIKKITTANNICPTWNLLADSTYQKLDFLSHLEKYNPCKQRYYICFDSDKVVCGAAVYSLKINLFMFSKSSLSISFSVIGLPASVDAAGIVGKNTECINALFSAILQQEKGLILCLNYNSIEKVKKIIKMQTLPTLIFEKKNDTWDDFLNSVKHNYRHRILKAESKIKNTEKRTEPCSCFTKEHYNQYLAVMERTKTKLEVLSFDFFYNLPETYQLISIYHGKNLLVWHISTSDSTTYYFLFGGMNYELRDKFDSYYNNLISIIKEGFDTECKMINLGQTATIPKNRLGSTIVPLSMFFYHHNPLIRLFLFLGKKLISYKIKEKCVNIYKSELL
jgi:hypothetical protein